MPHAAVFSRHARGCNMLVYPQKPLVFSQGGAALAVRTTKSRSTDSGHDMACGVNVMMLIGWWGGYNQEVGGSASPHIPPPAGGSAGGSASPHAPLLFQASSRGESRGECRGE